MPGRQSTGPVPLLKTRPPQKKRKRAGLDAFAVAEAQTAAAPKIRASRLGQIEGSDSEEDRQPYGGESEEEDRHDRGSKRTKVSQKGTGVDYEQGHDSDGNEWVTNHVHSDNDSSIDSDEAMGASEDDYDELRAINGTNKVTKKSGIRKLSLQDSEDEVDLDESEAEDLNEDSEAESEAFAAEAVDLATVLDERDSASEDESLHNPRGNAKLQTLLPIPAPESRDIDEISQLSFSEEENEGQEEAKRLAGLHDFVHSLSGKQDEHTKLVPTTEIHESLAPTDFGITSKKKLSIHDMIKTISDPSARKNLRALTAGAKSGSGSGSGIPGKLAVPLAKREQDRIDRSVAYEKSKATLERWVETVKHNRRAEHLQFPLSDPAVAAAKSNVHLATDSAPRPLTALESAIHKIMEESGIDANNGKSQDKQIQEFEELAVNKLPIEEVRARRAQLRQARELLFREERKAKRIKKIKSKSWRRVHRKERERNALREQELLAEAGIEPDAEEVERMHRQRAEERMGSRHRASRWAKGIKSTGRAAWDEDARAGIHEMARREEELKKRIQGHDVEADSVSDSGSESDDESSEDESGHAVQRLRSKIDQLQDQNNSRTGLHSLKFMQKAEAARKAQNDEDIERLRRDLAGEETPDEGSEDEEPSGRQKFGPGSAISALAQTQERNEFEELAESDDADVEFAGVDVKKATNGATSRAPKAHVKPQPRDLGRPRNESDEETGADNPWLTLSKKSRSKRAAAPNNVQISTSIENSLGQTSAPKSAAADTPANPKAPTLVLRLDDSDSSDAEADTPGPTNEALIRQAFAADDVLAASDFAAEKAQLEAEEAAAKHGLPEDNEDLPGWGSWVGAGVTNQRRVSRPKRAPAPTAAVASGAADADDGDGDDNAAAAPANPRVQINRKRLKGQAAYLATQLPHPFETRDQYERSLRLPIGPEWSTRETFLNGTRPRVTVRSGEVVAPMRRPLV